MPAKKQKSFFQALPPRLQIELREAYADAVRDGREEFRAVGHDWVTHYVKYLLEYEDSKTIRPINFEEMAVQHYAKDEGADMKGDIQIMRDEVAERLDEMADLFAYWQKNRAKGRTPNAVRNAILMAMDEIALLRAAKAIPPEAIDQFRKQVSGPPGAA